jgi:hypothetical protein
MGVDSIFATPLPVRVSHNDTASQHGLRKGLQTEFAMMVGVGKVLGGWHNVE